MNRLAWLAILLFWIVLGLWLSYKYICKTTPAAVVPASGLVCADMDDDLFGFQRSSFSRPSTTDKLIDRVTSVAIRLSSNPSESAIITGCYDTEELNRSSFENLGEARANSIKSWLMDNGASPSQIILKSRVCDDAAWTDDVLCNAIDISFGDIDDLSTNQVLGNSTNLNVVSPATIKSSVASNLSDNTSFDCGDLMTINFYYNREKFELTPQQSDCLETLLARQGQNGGSLKIAGHTDDEEYDEAELSLLRANKVKDFLVSRMSADPSTINTYGYGADQGLAGNCSPAGRAKNRRVEISLN